MGSPCEIQLFAQYELLARQIANIAIADIQRLEAKYSRYRNDSELSKINRIAAKGGSIEVDEETAGLLNYAATCYQQSDGLFDISSGILRKAWRFDKGQLPKQKDIDVLLSHIGWHRIRWSAPTLEFPSPGMELDFGGIVKEYAADRAAELCKNAGAFHGVVNLGGDVKIIGPRADGRPWRIGINHPRQPDALMQTLSIEQGAVASSGDYERCIVIDGVRYAHVINPKTGWPVKHLAAVSVVSDFCVIAGSASTIAMLKEKQGPAWLESMGLPYLWFDVDGNQGGSLLEQSS
ncbi:MAG: FAD:protein FMN transferase [Methylomonas lenta]|nr:FAD:protein FMN transferase [Methylomonas lenta]